MAVRAARAKQQAPRQRTWGEPAGLESCAAARHTRKIRDEPFSTVTGTDTAHSDPRGVVLRVTKSVDCAETWGKSDSECGSLLTRKNNVGCGVALASWTSSGRKKRKKLSKSSPGNENAQQGARANDLRCHVSCCRRLSRRKSMDGSTYCCTSRASEGRGSSVTLGKR